MKQIYEDILSALKYISFDELTEEWFSFEDDIIDYLDEKYRELFNDCATGVTKIVLSVDKEDFVVKIPFIKYLSESGEGYGTVEDDDIYIQEARNLTYDYCKEEVRIYREAREFGIEELFAETSYLGSTRDGHPIYIQPKCTIFSDNKVTSYNRHTEAERDSMDSFAINRLDKDWLLDVKEYYGEETLDILITFIKDEFINDLHNDNIGYIQGRPVIFDYSGFYF